MKLFVCVITMDDCEPDIAAFASYDECERFFVNWCKSVNHEFSKDPCPENDVYTDWAHWAMPNLPFYTGHFIRNVEMKS